MRLQKQKLFQALYGFSLILGFCHHLQFIFYLFFSSSSIGHDYYTVIMVQQIGHGKKGGVALDLGYAT